MKESVVLVPNDCHYYYDDDDDGDDDDALHLLELLHIR